MRFRALLSGVVICLALACWMVLRPDRVPKGVPAPNVLEEKAASLSGASPESATTPVDTAVAAPKSRELLRLVFEELSDHSTEDREAKVRELINQLIARSHEGLQATRE